MAAFSFLASAFKSSVHRQIQGIFYLMPTTISPAPIRMRTVALSLKAKKHKRVKQGTNFNITQKL